MRMIHVDVTPVLPILDTGRSKYAMWIRLHRDDIPRTMTVDTVPGGEMVLVRLSYRGNYPKPTAWELTEKSLVYVEPKTGRIMGLDLPGRRFLDHFAAALASLRERADRLNYDKDREHYRLIMNILYHHRSDLFMPPQ